MKKRWKGGVFLALVLLLSAAIRKSCSKTDTDRYSDTLSFFCKHVLSCFFCVLLYICMHTHTQSAFARIRSVLPDAS